MKKQFTLLLALLLGANIMNANPVSMEKAKAIGQKFASEKLNSKLTTDDLKLVYTGVSDRNEACFYTFNVGSEGFVIVSADDRFRPIVGYSNEGTFSAENMSPELRFYLDKIIEARTSPNAVMFDNTAAEWQNVMETGQLLSRNKGRGVDYLCSTKWNQDSPYNLYAPEASGGPGGRCYAGCVATAMSQVMKYWDHPAQGTGSHSYYCYGHGRLSADFGKTTYDWANMPNRLGASSTEEEIDAIALLMYQCAVAVDMNFSPSGSGANSYDVPGAIRQYFSYSNQAVLHDRDSYTLKEWQNKLKESFDLGWPLYYSGFSDTGGHAFVCDGYDDNDLFHFNWGWGGSSDGWFVIDEIDYAGWAQAVFNFVPKTVYENMPLQPENLTVISNNDFQYSAVISWENPTQNIHMNQLNNIDQIVVTRNDEVIFASDNAIPGASMSFTDHYLPVKVKYGVYAIVKDARGLVAFEDNVILGPSCRWSIETSSSDANGWHGGNLSFVNEAGIEMAKVTCHSSQANQTLQLPFGHIKIIWTKPTQAIDRVSFKIKDADGNCKAQFEGPAADLPAGLFFIINNTCGNSESESEAPKNLSALAQNNNIVLAWDTITGAINYHIYRDNSLIAVTTETTYTDSNAVNAFHSYYVTACTNTGETMPSNTCHCHPESSCMSPSNLRYELTTPSKPTISWDAPQDENITGYILYRRVPGEDFKRIKLLTKLFHTDNLTNLPDNRYEYAVVAYYQGIDCQSGYATAGNNPALYTVSVNKTIIPQHLSFVVHDNHVTLRWQEATMATSYNVYRNGERIAEAVTDTEFIDYTYDINNDYYYTVTGCTEAIESNHSNVVFVKSSTSVGENDGLNGIAIHPNPTSGIIYIETFTETSQKTTTEYRVTNLMGQEIMRLTPTTSQTIIDLSGMPQGIYFIQVDTTLGKKTFKVIKTQ